MKEYGHLPGYLHRWKLFSFGRFMARVHKILDIDRTPFLHSHPFFYISIVLKGRYVERVLQKDGSLKRVVRKPGSIIFRSPFQFHRIDQVEECTTLFFTLNLPGEEQNWTLRRHPKVKAPKGYKDWSDGLYIDEKGFRRREGGVWYVTKPTIDEAQSTSRLSIHQNK